MYLVVAIVVGRVVAAVVAALVVAAAGRLDPSELVTVWVGANTVYFFVISEPLSLNSHNNEEKLS